MTKTINSPVVITNMFIKSNDCRCLGLRVTKDKPAQEAVAAVEAVKGVKAEPAVEAVAAVKAIPAVLDEKGNIITPAVEAVKAVKAKPAVEEVKAVKGVEAVEAIPAVKGHHKICIQAVNLDVLNETLARLADQGYPLQAGAEVEDIPYGKAVWLQFPGADPIDMKKFRVAFKNIKSKTLYNKAGFEELEQIRKEKSEIDKKARAAAAAVKAKAAAEAAEAIRIERAAAVNSPADITTKSDPTLSGAKVIAAAGSMADRAAKKAAKEAAKKAKADALAAELAGSPAPVASAEALAAEASAVDEVVSPWGKTSEVDNSEWPQ